MTKPDPAALTPDFADWLLQVKSGVWERPLVESALKAIADGSHIVIKNDRESLIAALAELEPGLMVVGWKISELFGPLTTQRIRETAMRQCEVWLSGLRHPSQPK